MSQSNNKRVSSRAGHDGIFSRAKNSGFSRAKNYGFSRAKNFGFSLVELIVVIAIMAILVGVAVPVYTGYIAKTQKAKDVQLVDEIERAVGLAAIAENWAGTYGVTADNTYIGAVVLSQDGASVVGADGTSFQTELDDAMKATFGDTYSSDLSLAYDGWTGTLSGSGASYVVGSSYAGKTSQLLGDVQTLTDALNEFLQNEGYKDQFAAMLGTDQDYTTTEMANMATLLVAQSTQGSNAEDFTTLWSGIQPDEHGLYSLDKNILQDSMRQDGQLDMLSALAAEYARLEAIVNYVNDEDMTAAFQFFSNQIGGSTVEEVLGSFDMSIFRELDDDILEKIKEYYTSGQAETDANAYLALMQQVSSAEDIIFSDVSNPSLYTDSALLSYVNNYMSAADILSAAASEDGDVVIIFTLDVSGALRANAYPLDY